MIKRQDCGRRPAKEGQHGRYLTYRGGAHRTVHPFSEPLFSISFPLTTACPASIRTLTKVPPASTGQHGQYLIVYLSVDTVQLQLQLQYITYYRAFVWHTIHHVLAYCTIPECHIHSYRCYQDQMGQFSWRDDVASTQLGKHTQAAFILPKVLDLT